MGDFWFLAPIKKITEHVNIFCILILYIVMINRTSKIHFQHKIPNQNLYQLVDSLYHGTQLLIYQVCCQQITAKNCMICASYFKQIKLYTKNIENLHTVYIYCVHQYGRQSRLNLIKLKSQRIKASPRILTYSHASISLQRLIFDTPLIP